VFENARNFQGICGKLTLGFCCAAARKAETVSLGPTPKGCSYVDVINNNVKYDRIFVLSVLKYASE